MDGKSRQLRSMTVWTSDFWELYKNFILASRKWFNPHIVGLRRTTLTRVTLGTMSVCDLEPLGMG